MTDEERAAIARLRADIDILHESDLNKQQRADIRTVLEVAERELTRPETVSIRYIDMRDGFPPDMTTK